MFSEATIKEKLLNLDPGRFQLLAEWYAQIKYPKHFHGIIPTGRNVYYAPTKGMPDAIGKNSSGKKAANLEATKQEKWWKHLEDKEIPKAEKDNSNGETWEGFLFITSSFEKPPKLKKNGSGDYSVDSYHKRFRNAGVKGEINIILGDELVTALAMEARFAKICTELLNLRVDFESFVPLIEKNRIFGCDDNPSTFMPSIEDFKKGRVNPPTLTGKVKERLEKHQWALVRGRGAAGKTTLAVSIAFMGALNKQKEPLYPVYYVDFAEDPSLNGILTAFINLRGEGVLFIADNVHLNEDIALNLFQEWKKCPNESRLLMMGRHISSNYHLEGRAPPLENLEKEALTLEVEPGDLVGVYKRLASRLTTDGNTPEPPAEVVQKWLEIFEGDLIAFSFAVADKIRLLIGEEWDISEDDAILCVKKRYLNPPEMTPDERQNLLRAAVLAKYEIELPTEALVDGEFPHSLRDGVIKRVKRGGKSSRKKYYFYKFEHNSIGKLIWVASGNTDEDGKLKQVAQKSNMTAYLLASRLYLNGRENLAKQILDEQATNPSTLRKFLLAHNLIYTRSVAMLMVAKNVATTNGIDENLMGDIPLLLKCSLSTPLHILESFLDYAQGNLPSVYNRLTVELQKPANVESLLATILNNTLPEILSFILIKNAKIHLRKVHDELNNNLGKSENYKKISETVLKSPLHFLIAFLDYAQGNLPSVYNRLTVELQEPANVAHLFNKALNTSLENLSFFLGRAKKHLRKVHDELNNNLGKSENYKKISETALKSPLHFLTSFLGYAKGNLSDIYESLRVELQKSENVTTLIKTASQSPLDSVANFLSCAKDNLPEVYSKFVTLMSNGYSGATEEFTKTITTSDLDKCVAFINFATENLPVPERDVFFQLFQRPEVALGLVERVYKSSLTEILSIFKIDWLAATIIPKLNADLLHAEFLKVSSFDPHPLLGIGETCRHYGQFDICEALTSALLKNTKNGQWNLQSVNLDTISYAIKFGAKKAGPDATRQFLDTVVTKEWLRRQYSDMYAGPLAAALFALWGAQDESVLSHFRLPELSARFAEKAKQLKTGNGKTIFGELQLIGVAALWDDNLDLTRVGWPTQERLGIALVFFRPEKTPNTIGHVRIQLWLGLRQMARLCDYKVRVPNRFGEETLALWEVAKPDTDKQRSLNKSMIQWLRECQNNNWLLVSPPE